MSNFVRSDLRDIFEDYQYFLNSSKLVWQSRHLCALQVPTMRQRDPCISHGSNVEQNALRSWHATMHKFVTSMVLCVLGMQQCAMHNATIQKTTFFELGVS